MTRSSFVVRPTAVGDVPAVTEVVKASWARTYNHLMGEELQTLRSNAKHVPELFLPEIGSDTGRSFVAVADGEIVGHVGGFRKGDRFFIDRIHVDIAWHGTGVAVALLDALKADLPADPDPRGDDLWVIGGEGGDGVTI